MLGYRPALEMAWRFNRRFDEFTVGTGDSQIRIGCATAVFSADEMVDLEGEPVISLVKEAILAKA